MKLTLRFLKVAKILQYLVEYVETRRKQRSPDWHWSAEENIIDIFNRCSFTSFLKAKGILVYGQYCWISSVFQRYLEFIEDKKYEEAYDFVKGQFVKIEDAKSR